MKLEDMEKIAAEATPGPWTDNGDWHSWTEDQGYAASWVETKAGDWRQYGPSTGSEMCQQRSDAKFISAFNPETVLRLLAVVRVVIEARSELPTDEAWRTVLGDTKYRAIAKALEALGA